MGQQKQQPNSLSETCFATHKKPSYQLRFTVKEYERDLRAAVVTYKYHLIILFVNSIKYEVGDRNVHVRAVELIKRCKSPKGSLVVAMTSRRPRGFAGAAEQAGVDALVDIPYDRESLAELLLNSLPRWHDWFNVIPFSFALRRQPPRRIVLLNPDLEMLERLSKLIRACCHDAAIVACTDSRVAWDELHRSPPDLFVTDLIHNGVSGFEMLERLADLKAAFPTIVVSDQLPEREPVARARAGPDLAVSYWPKTLDKARLKQHIEELLSRG